MKIRKGKLNVSAMMQALRDLAAKKLTERAKNPPVPVKKTKPKPEPADKLKFKPATTWQLLLDSPMNVTTAPWPPRSGPAKLKVEMTPFDGPEKFEGTIAFRITKTAESPAAWKRMPVIGENKDCSVFYEAPITLAKGKCFIQFRISGQGEKVYKRKYTDLTDWLITVK